MKINVKLDINDVEELVDDIKECLRNLKYLYSTDSSRRIEALEQVLRDIADSCNKELLLYGDNSYEAFSLKKVAISIEGILYE